MFQFFKSFRKSVPKAIANSFCVAPWVHAHVDASGQRRLCCIATNAPEIESKKSFTEYYNSDYIQAVRKKMLSGCTPNECIACVKPNKVEVYRDTLNQSYRHHISRILNATDSNGFSNQVFIRFLDYRSIVCNLSCITCGPYSSSKWISILNHDAKFRQEAKSDEAVSEVENSLKNKVYVREFMTLVNSYPLDKIYFAGGEPLVSPIHNEVLNSLISSKKADCIDLIYNTNAMISKEKTQKWLSQISHFKNLQLRVSVDGGHDLNEFVRAGTDHNIVLDNISLIKKSGLRNMTLFVDTTITSLLLLNWKPFVEMIIRMQVPVVSKLMISNGLSAAFLQVEAIDLKIRKKIINEFILFYEKLNLFEKKLLEDLRNNFLLSLNFPDLSIEEKSEFSKNIQLYENKFSKVGFVTSLDRNNYLIGKSKIS